MGAFISWINENMPKQENQGEAQENQPQSLSGELRALVWFFHMLLPAVMVAKNFIGMVSTLVPVLVISAVYIIIFLFLRLVVSRLDTMKRGC